jgi:hypothetical protein
LSLRKAEESTANLEQLWKKRLKVTCKACGSENQRDFPVELTFCFDSLQSTLKNTTPVDLNDRARVCLECGFAELVVPQAAVLLLKYGDAASGQGVELEGCLPS